MAMRQIFWGFCINRFLMSPLHYLSSRSDFGFEFAKIFIFEKRIPDSPSWGVDKIANKPFKKMNGDSTLQPWLIFCWIGTLKGPWFSRHRSQEGSCLSFTNISANLKPESERLDMYSSVRDLCWTDLCKKLGKSASLPCPFKCCI